METLDRRYEEIVGFRSSDEVIDTTIFNAVCYLCGRQYANVRRAGKRLGYIYIHAACVSNYCRPIG